MIGPDLDVPGGVSAVENAILKYPPPGVQVDFHPTLTRHGAASAIRSQPIRYAIKGSKILTSFIRLYNSVCKKAKDYDLCHVHVASYGSTFRKYFVCRKLSKTGCPYILHNHGAAYEAFYESLNPLLKQKVRHMFLSGRGTIVLSNWWYGFHRRILADDSHRLWILPNPVPVPPVPCWEQSSITSLLFLGRLDERKGAARVIRAISQLPQQTRERVRLQMAGDGAVDDTRALAEQLGVAPQVEIRDWIAGAEKEAWMQQTNVFILPSRNEGLPMAMLEAMAWGKALIVSPVGGIPEFVTDGVEGFLVPPDDIDAIADAIRKLAENPDLRVQMGMAARKRVEPLDIQNYRIRLGEIYREALSRAK